MTTRAFLAGIILAAAWSAPVAAAPAQIDYARINDSVVAQHVRPRIAAFADWATAQRAAMARLCPAAEAPALEAAREAFHGAVDGWQSVEHLRAGPAAETNAHPRLNFWPDRRGRVGKHLRRLLAAKTPVDPNPKAFAGRSVAVQGFPALERLLFAEDAPAGLKRAAGPVGDCDVAVAIANNIAAVAGDLDARWTTVAGGSKPAKTMAAAFFNDLATGLGAVADLKLGAPLGEKTGRVRPKRAEHWRSGRPLRNVTRNLAALRDLYGHIAATAGPGLAGTPADGLIRQQFDAVVGDAEALGPSLAEHLATEAGRLRVKVLADGIRDLRELVIVNVSEALGLVLGFNSFDGD